MIPRFVSACCGCTGQVTVGLLLLLPPPLPPQEGDTVHFPDMVSPSSVGEVMEFFERYKMELASVDERLATLKATLDKLKEEVKVGAHCALCVCVCVCARGHAVCRFHL